MSSTANSSTSIMLFIILTTIYAFVKYNTSNTLQSVANNMYFYIYLLIVLLAEYFVNLNLTTSICGSSQWTTALIVTILPWGIIFGILTLLLTMFPGWLSPFSNTFGYAIALMAGLNDIFADIIEPNPKGVKVKPEESIVQQALAHIYSDKSLLINEITVDNFDYFWDSMKGVFKQSAYENDTLKNNLYSMVVLKNTVSMYIWYILTGILITSISYNYIINSGCKASAAEMQQRYVQYEQELSEAQTSTAPAKRVYTTTE
uniref:Uncharacterized protein n=1 Tax=viral metagenome TaxID=1070528 RepID=A0A6C0JZJ0_9ZZZZ